MNEHSYPQFGQILASWLEKEERSQKWLAQRISFSDQTVSRWINNGNRPGNAETIVISAIVLNRPFHDCQEALNAADYGEVSLKRTLVKQQGNPALKEDELRHVKNMLANPRTITPAQEEPSIVMKNYDFSIESKSPSNSLPDTPEDETQAILGAIYAHQKDFDKVLTKVHDTTGQLLTSMPTDATQQRQELTVQKQLPLSPPDVTECFENRESIVPKICSGIRPGAIILLHGMGGIGKTQLIAKVSEELENRKQSPEDFPKRIIYFDIFRNRDYHDVGKVYNDMARVLGAKDDISQRTAVQGVLAQQELLIILDGLECAIEKWTVDEVESFIKMLPGNCAMLLTGRTPKDFEDIKDDYPVHELKQSSARTLLQNLVGEKADAQTIDDIIKVIGRSPLAVTLAGRGLKKASSAEEYLDKLLRSPLDVLDKRTETNRSKISFIIEFSVSQLDEQTKQVLAFFGHAIALGPSDKDDIVNWSGFSSELIHEALDQLVEYGLLDCAKREYIPANRLIYYYAREKLESPIQEDMLHRMGNSFLSIIDEQVSQIRSDIRHYIPHIAKTIQLQAEYKLWEPLLELAEAIFVHLSFPWDRYTRQSISEHALSAALKVVHENLIEDKTLVYKNMAATWSLRSGDGHMESGDYKKAIRDYKKGLTVVTNDKLKQQLERSLSAAYYANNEPKKAVETTISQPDFQKKTAPNEKKQNNADQSLKNALRSARRKNNVYDKLRALIGLGHEHHVSGKIGKATRRYEDALTAARDVGDKDIEGLLSVILGDLYHFSGKPNSAIEQYGNSLSIAQHKGDKQSQGICYGKLSVVYMILGEMIKANEYCQKALEIAREINNSHSKCEALNNLSYLYCDWGKYVEAQIYAERALTISSNSSGQAKALYNLSRTHYYAGHIDDAIEYGEECLKIAEKFDDSQLMARAYICLGNANLNLASQDSEHLNTVKKYYREVEKIAKKTNDPWLKSAIYNNLALSRVEKKPTNKTLAKYSEAKRVAKKYKFVLMEGIIQKNRGNAYNALNWRGRKKKQWDEASKKLQIVQSPFQGVVRSEKYGIAIC